MVQNNKEFHLMVDGKNYKWHQQTIKGVEIRQIGQISDDYQIFLKLQNHEDQLINDEDIVDLARPGIEHFYSKKHENQHGYTIIVNGREKHWQEKTITYEQVVKLAFEKYVENGDIVYTVDFTDGPHQNPSGSMVKGDFKYITNKMIFNVTATNRS
jgi:hypothetical protein